MRNKRLRWVLFAAALFLAAVAAALYLRSVRVSPRMDGERNGIWTPYGGVWRLLPDGIRNDSDERGAKLLTGSREWKDYSVEADVAVLGDYGDSGLIIRAQDPEQGVDSYRGYFAGLRTLDNALIFGAADYGWKQYRAIRVPGDVQRQHFYHIRLAAAGCLLAVRVDLPDRAALVEAMELKRCVPSGQSGLKSFQSPGMWRNIRIRPVTRADVLSMIGNTPIGRSADHTLLRRSSTFNELEPLHREALNRRLEGTILPIGQLQLRPIAADQTVFIRGAVTLNDPLTFVQDATGAIEVATPMHLPLSIGEDVEIAGKLQRLSGRPRIQAETVKELGASGTASTPLVSPEEAATGRLDGRTVAVNGEVLHEAKTGADGSVAFDLSGSGEAFRVIYDGNPLSPRHLELRPGSRVQAVGVVLTDPRFTGGSAFAILTPSSNALRVLSGPPLFTVGHIVELALLLFCVAIGSTVFYVRVRHNYVAGLVKEREMLAHDLHDTISQSFAGVGFQLNAIRAGGLPHEEQRHQFERAQTMIRNSHDELRRSIAALRTELTTSTDLRKALVRNAQMRVEGGGLHVRTSEEGASVKLPARLADAFFRIGQEAISNAIHHADARSIEIRTEAGANTIALSIRDDGRGLPPHFEAKGSGLYGMRRRAEMVSASLSVESSPAGTLVRTEAHLKRGWRERLLRLHLHT